MGTNIASAATSTALIPAAVLPVQCQVKVVIGVDH
jgi:hypothetical protein